MSVNQYQIGNEHPADQAMQREIAGTPPSSALTPEELAHYSSMHPIDMLVSLANSTEEVPKDSLIRQMSKEQLGEAMRQSQNAIRDFRAAQQAVGTLEAKVVATQNPAGVIGVPMFDSSGNVRIEGSEFQKAEQAVEQSRRSAAMAGLRDLEYNQAVAQLAASAPNAPVPATASGAPYEIRKGSDGSYDIVLDTNEHFVGKDADEVIQKLTHSKHKSSKWGRELNAELKQYRNGQTPSNQPNLNAPASLDGNSPQFNADIAEQFAKSVGFSGAEEMISDYQRTQAQLAEMESRLQKANEFASKYEDQQVSEQFIAMCPSFPGDERSINELMKVMSASDLDFGKPENLALAHEFCVRQHFYEPLRPEEYQPQSQQTSDRRVPPPPPPGNNPDGSQINSDPWRMAKDELAKKVLEGGGMGRALMEMTPGSTFGG